MDQAASDREAETESPQYDKYDDYCPEHDIFVDYFLRIKASIEREALRE
jgi:hypothetical protein